MPFEWVPALRCIAKEALHRVRDTSSFGKAPPNQSFKNSLAL
jgi:hypothetical protein